MSISSRIHDTLEGWQAEWKERLRGWMASWLERGVLSLLEAREPEIIALTQETIDMIKRQPNIPPELLHILEKSTKTGQIGDVIAGYIYSILGSVFALLSLGAPVGRTWEYAQERAVKSFRLDPVTLTAIWLRDKPGYEKFWDDLRDQGWNEDRIDIGKELAKIIPPLADMVRFADFSAFDPEVIEKWRKFYDAPSWILDPFALLGITNEAPRDWANKYWFSHFVQPGRYELGEMYRRGLLGKPLVGQDEIGGGPAEGEAEDTIKLAYRTMAYSAFWQDRLLQLVREVPTRVDVRRWWDMRTIDETELREIYQRQGYFGKDLENYVLWTKVYVAFPDLIARWKNGWIQLEDVRTELTGLGMPADRVEEMIQTKMKATKPERTVKERDLTKTDITKWVKEDPPARWAQGLELLGDLGYDTDEADMILTARVELEGSPETFEEYKQITQKYRIAAGMEARPMTEELKITADEVVRLTAEVEALEKSITEEKRGLIEGEVLPPETTARLEELQVTRNRAISELERVKSEYERLLAEWRHG